MINALVLATRDRDAKKQIIDDDTAKAFQQMWSTQLEYGENAGSWDWLDFSPAFEPWESPSGRYHGATLAALAISSAPSSDQLIAANPDQISRLQSYLKTKFAGSSTHHQMSALWAHRSIGGILSDQQITDLKTQIIEKQSSDGSWAMSSLGAWNRQVETGDGYATGLAVVVLQGEETTETPKENIQMGLKWLRESQLEDGSWPSESVNKDRSNSSPHLKKFMRDAATGFAVMALLNSQTDGS